MTKKLILCFSYYKNSSTPVLFEAVEPMVDEKKEEKNINSIAGFSLLASLTLSGRLFVLCTYSLIGKYVVRKYDLTKVWI